MRKQNNIRVLELLKYLYLRTDEKHPATIADMLDYLSTAPHRPSEQCL